MIRNWLEYIGKYKEFALAISIVLILLVLLFPVPTHILDILLALSITISIIILMSTLFISKPLELSVFPTMLLVTTILRLSLNIASTRLILADGHKGPFAAGEIIQAFGHFVMQGNVVIGLIVFLILTIINFIVITKGSGRIAEVAARFSLDAMPGKQMAIDADLAAGLIEEKEARQRRKDLEDENTFFGAMDGANKFVRGDAIAGLIITFINLIGGIIIGVVQRNLSFDIAVKTYTILTIGDGLVSQIPSLIISLSSGLLVSKSGVVGSAEKAIFEQFSKYPQAFIMTGFVSALMGVLPGLPTIPFLFLSGLSFTCAYFLITKKKIEEESIYNKQQEEEKLKEPNSEEAIMESLQLDMIKLELGYNLLQLVNYHRGHKLTDQVKALRKQIAQEYGFIMPSVRIQDNLQIGNDTYIIKIKEIECAKGEIDADKFLVMDPKGDEISIPGIDTKEPAFGLPAKWITEDYREDALFKNYTVVDPPTVVTTHLTEVIKENIMELLSYSEVQKLVDELETSHPRLVKDLIPEIVSISNLQKILQNLLSESISIRDLPTILEATSDIFEKTKNIMIATEHVRIRLSRQICSSLANNDGYITVVSLSSEWENEFLNSIKSDEDSTQLFMAPSKIHEFTTKVRKNFDSHAADGILPILLTSGVIRPYVRSVIERFRSSITVISQNEIHPKTKIRTIGVI